MEAAAHPHPIAAAPVADEREGPAADGLVQPTGDVFGELLAFPDRQIVDAVPANVLGRNVARVGVAKRQSLRWGEIRIAQDLVVLGNQGGVTRTIGVEAAVAVAGTARIGRGHGMGISVKRLGRESTRESVVEFELDRLGVGIAVVLERPICAAPVGVETPEIGIARVTTRTEQAGCGAVIIQRLGIVPGPALLQVAAVITDVAGPQSSVFAQFALNGERCCLIQFRSVLAKRNGAVSTAPQFTKPECEMRSRLRTFPIKLVHGKNVVRVKPRRYSYHTGDHCLNSLFRLL